MVTCPALCFSTFYVGSWCLCGAGGLFHCIHRSRDFVVRSSHNSEPGSRLGRFNRIIPGSWVITRTAALQSFAYCDWIAVLMGISTMTGPRPAGRPWTAADEAQLGELLASGMKVGFIARKLKRSRGAIYARINSVRKTPRDLAFAAQRLSRPSKRLLHAQASAESSQIDDTT